MVKFDREKLQKNIPENITEAKITVRSSLNKIQIEGSDTIKISGRVFAAPVFTQSFAKGEIYAYPNPAKNGKSPTIHIECGIADEVEIKIYNIAAELVHSVTVNNQPSTVNGRYAYEYNWDISDIASGVYIYTIRAKKEGYKDIKSQGTLAIIK